jgi:hypothetical protein
VSAPDRVAIASRPEAREAAEEMLGQGGSALDAALAGYLASAGATPWALMAPVLITVAGVGSGVRFVDGRARQPGQGLERPQRFADEAKVPAQALVSVPTAPVALALAVASFGSKPLSQLVAAGVRFARADGADSRASMLERLAQAKVLMLLDRGLQSEIRSRLPRIEGALLGSEDFESLSPEVAVGGAPQAFAGRKVLMAPWSGDAGLTAVVENGRGVVLAADARGGAATGRGGAPGPHARGGLAAVVFERPERNLSLFDGQIELPMLAQPILKGVPRLKPGAVLPMAAPVVVVLEGPSAVALAASTRRTVDEAQLEQLVSRGDGPLAGWGEGNQGGAERSSDVLVVRRTA